MTLCIRRLKCMWIILSLSLEQRQTHVVDLRKLFDHLRKYKLQLNSAKCTFGVKSSKLLGLKVSEKDIEVDPDKVQAILEMPPPSIEKKVHGFLGRLKYIVRFISHLTATWFARRLKQYMLSHTTWSPKWIQSSIYSRSLLSPVKLIAAKCYYQSMVLFTSPKKL